MTKFQLFSALFARMPQGQLWTDSRGDTVHGILERIEREDGSGSSFNLCIVQSPGNRSIIHVRTID